MTNTKDDDYFKYFTFFNKDENHKFSQEQNTTDQYISYIKNIPSTLSSADLSSYDIIRKTKIPFYNNFPNIRQDNWSVVETEVNNEDKLLNEIIQLKKKLISIEEGKEENKDRIISLQQEISEREKIIHISTRINENGKDEIYKRGQLYKDFLTVGDYEMVVMAIDIRKSTELMLRSIDNNTFAEFISQLYKLLSDVIKANYGIIDKFTGDGLICFFPKIYTGKDFILYALLAAENCHDIFKDFYEDHYHCFSPVLADTGLGIGIDYGKVYFNVIRNEIVLIGKPVVYACRFSSDEPGSILLNQKVYEMLSEHYPNCFKIEKARKEIKDGVVMAYSVIARNLSWVPRLPSWKNPEQN